MTTPQRYIVVDLDGTLVHSSQNIKPNAIKLDFIDSCGTQDSVWIYKRPGFDEFLEKCFETAKVGVWSMGQPGYVEAIVSLFPRRPDFVFNWCDCDRLDGKVFKDLSKISFGGETLMIDDNPSILKPTSNVRAIIVPEWHHKQRNDKILYELTARL